MSKTLGKSFIGHQDISYLSDALISVPSSTIVKRAQIIDPSKGMAPIMGVDRVMVQNIIELQSEVGASGERVFKALNDDRDLIRFVGTWTASGTTEGQFINSNTINDYIEVVFYGTGLDILTQTHTSFDIRIAVDGGAESGNLITAGASVINGRKYSCNQIIPGVVGLTLGTHTAKIRNNSATGPRVFGFQILNERANVRVNPGTIIKNQLRYSLDAAQTLDYKPAALTGVRGGRVVTYTQGGNIAQAVSVVNGAQANLTLADHTNEEILRTLFWREFVAGRSDDFSDNGASPAAFALDDNTTVLYGVSTGRASQVTVADALQLQSTNAYVVLQFVGTGLDIWSYGDGAGGADDACSFHVDGTSIGTLSTARTLNKLNYTKVVSGLPYGTHTVKINRDATAGGSAFNIERFVVYGPKKPAIPTGALEISDHHVLADYVANATSGQLTVATGVVRKGISREINYVNGGTGSADWGMGNDVAPCGFIVSTNRQNAYLTFTFWGTGFEFRARGAAAGNSTSVQFSLQAAGGALQNLTTTNFPTMTSSFYGLNAFSASTGIADFSFGSTVEGGICVKTLPLGWYTLKVLNNSASVYINCGGIDVITPIHSPKSNLLSDRQNTLPVGSQSIADLRQIVSSIGTQNKAWAVAVGSTSNPTVTSTVSVPLADMSLVIKTSGNPIDISYAITHYNSTSGVQVFFKIVVDGIFVGAEHSQNQTGNAGVVISDRMIVPVCAGVHKVDVFWRVGANTGTAYETRRTLVVKEI